MVYEYIKLITAAICILAFITAVVFAIIVLIEELKMNKEIRQMEKEMIEQRSRMVDQEEN